MTKHHHRSAAAEAYNRWYKTAAWQRRRAAQLAAEPLCERCTAHGLVVPATVANHRIPHKGDTTLFWEGELESLCKPHHDITVQAEERRGFAVGNGLDGRPMAPDHPWNRPKPTQ